MINSTFIRCLAVQVLLLLPIQAAAQTLVTGLSLDKVEITSDFTGTELVVFGTIENIDGAPSSAEGERPTIEDFDVVVEIKGPGEPTIVRQKERILGIWINQAGQEYNAIPGSYLMMSTQDPEAEAFNEALAAFDVGFANVPLATEGAQPASDKYRDAIVRLKSEQGLYLQEAGISLIGENLFRARFQLPAVIPVGIHQVRSYLLYNNELVSGSTHAIRVSKSGFEQVLYRFSRDYGYIYGIVCVLLAMLTGWLGSVIFRRD